MTGMATLVLGEFVLSDAASSPRAYAPGSPKGKARPAFTLLEVLLSSAIAILLLGALYVAMQVELQQASEGRDLVERSTVARAIINRLSIDITPSMTPAGATATSGSSSGSSNGTASTTGTTPTTGTAATGASAATGAASAATTGSSMMSTTTPVNSVVPLKAGVIGTSQVLIVFATHVVDPKATGMSPDGTDLQVPSDIRRITYWLGTNGGLCRQELPWFSSDDAQSNSTGYVPEAGKTEESYLIAAEVSDLAFEYYDINATSDDSGWGDTWTGSDPGLDGTTPKGPPTAIRITFSIRSKGANGGDSTKQYRHVIALLTASGPDSSGDSSANGMMGTTPSGN